jgi:hypothetical protein
MMLFFSHLGRIHDNVEAAAMCLVAFDVNEVTGQLDEFYHQRHIFVHGKIMPLKFHVDGTVEMPVLSRYNDDPKGWNHKLRNWPDVLKMKMEKITETLTKLFWELMPVLTDIFGKFTKTIKEELAKGPYEIKFETIYDAGKGNMGSSGQGAASIYGSIIPANINTSGSF